ncbi:hypothetical protein LMH87_003820 [Akanthomyces muscarius]|uniref:Uncharacterized protein n=1 Tax=Akanthomyces muscarius TaxID=2231603 RepID=A0A9W8Q253_AKAMU|nr:hypothetical protein LMH87_003820 [Akanthomyces muscarius]KAJ4144953.1 hypothetical protein LMH87_003820 [Akanthomyces muscarius]
MARAKLGAKSIRGQISAPIPVPDSYEEHVEPTQLHQSREAAQQLGSRSKPQNQNTKTADDSTVLSKVQSGAQRVTIDKAADRSPTPEAGKRLSKSLAKEAPVRKRSPIRNVLGRLFGRRKKTPSQLTTASEPVHRSSAPPQQVGKNEKDDPPRGSGASRSTSLPVTEYDRALRSHSIGLDDVIAIQSARNSVAMDQTHTKKRSGGNTSPYPLGARYIGDGKLAGLCPRPASVNDRDLHSSAVLSDDPDEIGRAITSDAGGLKRRSRSMSAMSFFEANQEENRRRSQEMRDLRDSCYVEDALSPLSSEFPEDDALATFNLDLPNPPRPSAPEPTTPGPFMFGNLISEEEAANRQQVEEVTLNSRVNGIENRLHVLEDSVSLLRYKANPYGNVGWKPSDAALPAGLGIQTSYSYPTTRNPHHSLSMGIAPTSTRPSTGHSDDVFTESPSHNGGKHSSSYTTQQPALPKAARPTSEDTLLGQNSQKAPSQRHGSSLSEEQYTAILGLLETERSARVLLEAQVQQLTRQLNMLLSNQRRSDHKSSAPPAPVSVFEYDADESESMGSSSARYNVWHPQPGYSLDDSGIDPGMAQHAAAATGHAYDDDDTESASQVYATPNEETHAASTGAFGVYPDAEQQEESGSRPRTLSLSRMTMGHIPTAVM